MQQLGERRIVIVPTRTIAAAGTTNSVATLPSEIAKYTAVILILNVTAQSGTTPTLDVYVQQELPIAAAGDLALAVPTGTSVFDDFVHFPQVTTSTGAFVARVQAGGNVVVAQKDASLAAATAASGPIGTSWRIKEVVGGTTPSYTYTLTAILIP